MKRDSPMMQKIKKAGHNSVPQRKISGTMLDKMVDGREFESLLSYQFENVNIADEIRKSIEEVVSIRKRPLVCYVANVVKPSASIGIDASDDLPFNEMIREVQSDAKEIDVVLVTPGGYANQVAKFVNALRPRFDKVSFILLNQAMSAGTIFAMSGDEIIMRTESQIGPIDPQVRNHNGEFIPAQAIRTLIDDIRVRGELALAKKEPIPWTDIQILRNIDFNEVGNAISASEYSIQMTEEYLNNYKFRTWTKRSDGSPVSDEFRKQRSKEIASLLCDHSKWKNHGHAITREAAWEVCKLRILMAEDLGLERPMRRMWALFYWLFDTQPMAKFFVSRNYCIIRNVTQK